MGIVFGGCAVVREQIERFDVVNAAAVVARLARGAVVGVAQKSDPRGVGEFESSCSDTHGGVRERPLHPEC